MSNDGSPGFDAGALKEGLFYSLVVADFDDFPPFEFDGLEYIGWSEEGHVFRTADLDAGDRQTLVFEENAILEATAVGL